MSTSSAARGEIQLVGGLQLDRRAAFGGLVALLGLACGPAWAQSPARDVAQGAFASPYNFGAKGDGFTDDTSAFEAALATGAPVNASVGRFRLTRGLKVRSGQVLRGESSRACFFLVDHEFDSSAPAVIDLQGPEPGGELRDFSIGFSQPNTNDRTRLLPFPAAIRAQGVPRFKLSRLRIERARIAIDMRGNSGGAAIDDVEISAFDRAVWIDGSLDSVKIAKLHIWPFGLTKPQRAVYDDAVTEGIRVGRCDDITISQSIIFGLRKAAVFYRGRDGAAFGTLIGVDFDHCGGLIGEAANLRLVGCVFTLGVPDGVWLKTGEGLFTVVGGWFHANKALAGVGVVSSGAGALTMSDCVFHTGENDFAHMRIGGGTTFNLTGLTFIKAQNKEFSQALITAQRGAQGILSGLVASATAGGVLLRFDPDIAEARERVRVQGVYAPGWTVPMK